MSKLLVVALASANVIASGLGAFLLLGFGQGWITFINFYLGLGGTP